MNIVSYSTVLFYIEIISLFQYSLPYSQFSCPWCGHYITLFRINTGFIYLYRYLYRVATNNHKGDSYSSYSGKLYLLLLSLLLLHYLVYNRGREYCFVFNCALLHLNHCTFSILTPIFTIFLSLMRKLHYTCCIKTHLIYFYSYLYRVAINNHKGDSYSSSLD